MLRKFLLITLISTFSIKSGAQLDIYKIYDILENKNINYDRIKYEIENLIVNVEDIYKEDFKKSDAEVEKITETLMILKSYGLPHDLMHLTISKLIYFHGISKRVLYQSNLQNISLIITTRERIETLTTIMKKKDDLKMPISFWIHVRYYKEPSILNIKHLIDGSKMKRDFDQFVKAYPNNLLSLKEGNLAYKIYSNYYNRLLL